MSDRADPAPAPPPDAVLAVDAGALASRLGSVPDADNAILRLADGRRTAGRIVEEAGGDPAVARAALARLLDAGVLRIVRRGERDRAPQIHGTDAAAWFASPAGAPRAPGVASGRPSPSGSEDAGDAVVVIAPPPGAERARRRLRAWGLAALAAAGALLLGRALLERLRP